MRIPTYDSQVNVSAGQYNAVVNPPGTAGLDAVISGLQSVQEHEDKQRLEDAQVSDFTNKNNASLRLAEISGQLHDQIQNGGKYSDAVTKYKAEYQKVVDQYAGAMLTPSARAEAMATWERQGLADTLQLTDAVRARAKGDAVASANNQVDLLQSKMVNADDKQLAEISKQIGAQYGSIPGQPAAEGALRTRKAIQDGVANRVQYTAQNNPNTPQVALDQLEKHKNDLSPDNYLSMRGQLLNAVEKKKEEVGSAEVVSNYIASPLTAKAPNQRDVDINFNSTILANVKNMSTADYESQSITYSRQLGKVPTALQMQAATFLGSQKENMSDTEIATAASTARIVAALGSDEAMHGGTNSFSTDAVAKASLIVSRTAAGLDERKAVTSVMSQQSNKESETIYAQAKKDTLDKWNDNVNSIASKIGVPKESASMWQSEYADLKAMQMSQYGASPGEAKDYAVSQLKKKYGTFNGSAVTYPPTTLLPYTEKSWIDAGEAKFRESTGMMIPKGAKIIFSGDRDTMQQIAAGKKPDEVSFPMLIDTGAGIIPIMGKDGKPARVFANPTVMKVKPEKKPFGYRTIGG